MIGVVHLHPNTGICTALEGIQPFQGCVFSCFSCSFNFETGLSKASDDLIEANRNKPTLLRRMWEAVKALLEKLTGAEKQAASAAEQKLRAALAAAEKAAQNENAATEGGERYSTKKEVLALTGVDWMANNSSIKQQLQKHSAELAGMEPIAVVEYAGIRLEDLPAFLLNEVGKIGGKRMTREGSDVDLYNEVRRRLKEPMILDARYAHDISPDAWGDWRRAHRGRVNVSINGSGVPVDTAENAETAQTAWSVPFLHYEGAPISCPV